MMSRTPESLSGALRQVVERTGVPLNKQIRALEELFSLFTNERKRLRHTSYLDVPRYLNAYLRYHVPLNVARCACALDQVRSVCPQVDLLETVVDLGAGPGSASLATLYTLPGTPAREYTLYDRSRGALKVARRLFEASTRCSPAHSNAVSGIRARAATLPPVPRIPSAALVWMSMLLNELPLDDRGGAGPAEFVAHLTSRIPRGSVLVIIEPAQRAPGRRLLEIRDAFAVSRAWKVLAPCTHDRPCPLARIRSRPWCHFHFEWRPDRYVRRIAAPLGLSSSRSSLAFLAVARADSIASDIRGRARVIGDVMNVRNGGRGVYVCENGNRKVVSPPPRGSRRGDIIERKRTARTTDRYPGIRRIGSPHLLPGSTSVSRGAARTAGNAALEDPGTGRTSI